MTAVLTATRTTTLSWMGDQDYDGQADPGDVVTTRIRITNSGTSAATDLSVTDTLNGLTLDPSSVKITPIAWDDTLGSITGNTPIIISKASLLGNDSDPDGAEASLTISGFSLLNHVTITDNGDGTITLLPETGYQGLASFDYIITDAQGLTSVSTGRVSLTVDSLAWYVDNGYSGVNGASDGSYLRPFTSFVPLNDDGTAGTPGGADGIRGDDDVDGANAIIFVYNRGFTYTGGITLENGQTLYGDGHEVMINNMSIGAAGQTSGPQINYSTYGITLADGNSVRGVNLNGTANAAEGVRDGGGTVGNLFIDKMSIAGTGKAVDIDNGGVLNVTFNSLTSTGSASEGIHLQGVSGTFAAATGLIQTSAGAGVLIGASGGATASSGGAVNFTFGGDISSPGGSIVEIQDRTGGTVTFTGNITEGSIAAGTTGIRIDGSAGTINFNGQTFVSAGAGAGNGIALTNNSGTINFNPIGTGLDITTSSGSGLMFSGGTLNITGNANSINTTTGQIMFLGGTMGTGGIAFQTLSSGTSVGVGAHAIFIDNLDAAGAGIFSVGGVTIGGTGATADGIYINGSNSTFAFASATIDNTGGDGIEINGSTANGANGAVTFTTVNLDGMTGAGINIVGATNAVNINGGTIGATNDSGGDGVAVVGGTGAVTIAATIAKTTANNVVDINGHSTGAIVFSGNISSTGASHGIAVNGNSGTGTIDFTGASQVLNVGGNLGITMVGNSAGTHLRFLGGALDIDVTAGTGISANNGGQLTIAGSTNSVTATTGRVINIDGTTANITLRDASATSSGTDTAIFLKNTGTSGQFVVTGSASTAGSGGTLASRSGTDGQSFTGAGIYLENVSNVSLSNMIIGTTGGTMGNFGIYGQGVINFSLRDSEFRGAFGTSATASGGEGAIKFGQTGGVNGLNGVGLFEGNVILGGATSNLAISNASGVLNLTIQDSSSDQASFGANSATTGTGSVALNATGTANLTGVIQGVNFSGARGTEFFAQNGGSGTLDLQIGTGAAGSGGQWTVSGAGISVQNSGSGSTNFDLLNATISGGAGHGTLVHASAPAGQLLTNIIGNAVTGAGSLMTLAYVTSHIASNTFTNSANSNSVFLQSGTAGANATIVNNTINNTVGGNGLSLFLNGAGDFNVDLRGNTITGPSASDVSLDYLAGATGIGRIEDYSGSPTSAASIQAYVSGLNNGTGVSVVLPPAGWQFIDEVAMPPSPMFAAVSQGSVSTQALPAEQEVQLFAGAQTKASYLRALLDGRKTTSNPADDGDGAATIGNDGGGLGDHVLARAHFAKFAADRFGDVRGAVQKAAAQVDGTPKKVGPFSREPVGEQAAPAAPTAPATAPDTAVADDSILTQAELDLIVEAAIQRWIDAGATPEQEAAMRAVDVSLIDMIGVYLGTSARGAISIDTDGGGHGWFVDATPLADGEFNGEGDVRTAQTGGVADGKIDLLTVVMHELGHQIGLEDIYQASEADALMYGYANIGQRRLPGAGDSADATPGSVVGTAFALAPVAVGGLPAGKTVDIYFNSTVDTQTNTLIANPSNTATINGSNFTTITANETTTLDSLSLGSTVFFDADNDGAFDAGEGVSAVALTLFADTGTVVGELDANDTQLATTTSTAGGSYSFTGIAPGNYIVRVDASNFATGGALAGKRTTGGSADPDDNVDGDDNGVAAIGGSVASKAITLSFNNEGPYYQPGDGFSGADDNSTLDFGFITAPLPVLSIADVTQAEGQSGTTTFTFTVTLSEPAGPGGVTFDIATADGTAQDDTPASEDNDYVARSLTGQVIPAGQTTYTFDVTVNGDAKVEPNESFFVNVTNVVGATVSDGQGTATIANDDTSVSISDVSVREGNSGTTEFTFTVYRTGGSDAFSVDYASSQGTADGADFVATSGTLSFAAGEDSKTVTISVNGDTLHETDETFTVTLSNATGDAVIADGTGVGTILDDELVGDSGNNILTGTGNDDTFMLQQGGNDTVYGLAGNDGFFFGGAYTSADVVDGGAGNLDQIGLQGDYGAGLTLGTLTDVELIALLRGGDTRFGAPGTDLYDYNITATDSSVAAGRNLILQANTLQVGEDFTFNGSAETDGTFTVYGGFGVDTFTGGSGSDGDGFFFGQGRFGASDVINGGGSSLDQIGFQGDFTITFGAAQITNVEFIVLLSAVDTRFGANGGTAAYNLTMNDGNVAAGQRMIISGNSLKAGETLTFNGSAETNGSFRIFAGAGNDVLTGSRGGDEIHGGAGNDTLRGGAGENQLLGGAGDDIFVLSADMVAVTGSDAVTGGDGFDTVMFEGGGRKVTMSNGYELITEWDGVSAGGIYAGIAVDPIERWVGTANRDRFDFTGTSNAKTVEGAGGNDLVTGGSGEDTLDGGAGADELTGGAGGDMLYGGADADIFLVNDWTHSSYNQGINWDRIRDFQSGLDKVDLRAIDANIVGGTSNDAFTYMGYNVALGPDANGMAGFTTRVAGQLAIMGPEFTSANGAYSIIADLDGNGSIDMRIDFSNLAAAPSSSDILL